MITHSAVLEDTTAGLLGLESKFAAAAEDDSATTIGVVAPLPAKRLRVARDDVVASDSEVSASLFRLALFDPIDLVRVLEGERLVLFARALKQKIYVIITQRN